MARRNSVKDLSVKHEEHIAKIFNGKRSRSSGAAIHEDGDVRSEDFLFECKLTGSPTREPKSLPVFVQQLTKLAGEAWSTGKVPMLALRYYQPGHVLADHDGWIDLIVARADDVEWLT